MQNEVWRIVATDTTDGITTAEYSVNAKNIAEAEEKFLNGEAILQVYLEPLTEPMFDASSSEYISCMEPWYG